MEIADRHTGSDGGVCDQCCEKIDPDMFAVVQNLRALDALLKPHLPGLHSGKCVALTDMERFAWGAMSALCVHADKEFRPVTAPTPMTLLREYASTAGRPVDEVFVRRQGEHAGPYFVWAVAEGVEFRVAQVGRDDDAEFIAALIRERGHVPRGMRFGLHPGEHLTA